MGKVKTLQSSLNGGEVSPRLAGRPELPRYQSGLERCENFIPMVLGGATGRPGTRMITDAYPSEVERQMDVYTAVDDGGQYRGFCLDATPAMTRIFKGNEVVAVLNNAEFHFNVTQAGQFNDGYLYLVRPGAAPARIKRISDAEWLRETAPLTMPYMRPPGTDGITLAVSDLSGSITLTASAPFFVAGHVGLMLTIGSGKVQITEVTDSTHAAAIVIGELEEPAESTDDRNKTTTLVVSYTPPPEEPTAEPWSIICVAVIDYDVQAILATTEVSGVVEGVATQVTDSVDGNVKTKKFILTYTPPVGSTNAPWEVTYEIVVRFGIWSTVPLYTLTDTTVPESGITVQTYQEQTGTEPGADWKEQAWSDLRGWPVAVAFYEQRMILAGTRTYPTTVWGSKNGKPLDFTLSTDDDGAFALPLACADTPIRSLCSTDAIYVFTANREISIDTGNEKALTPTNFRIKVRTGQGASFMAPVKIGSDLIFSSVSSHRLYTLLYRFDANRFVANDVSLYGEHLVREGGGVVQVAVTREPHPMLWCRTASGGLITLTYDSEQQVAAWARHTLDGVVKKIASVPDSTGNDQVWLAIERNGQINIEVFDWSLQTDSAVTGSDAEGKETWDGLLHLEGKEVVAVADGYVVQGLVVDGGMVTLPFPAKAVEIGLPFIGRVKDLPLGVAGNSATIAQQASLNEIRVLLHETKGCRIGKERVPFQKFDGDLLDKPVRAYTGWKKVGALGWDDNGAGGQVEIIRDLPLPCTVLAIFKEITING